MYVLFSASFSFFFRGVLPVKVSGFAASRAFRVERLRFFYFVRVLRGVFVLEIR